MVVRTPWIRPYLFGRDLSRGLILRRGHAGANSMSVLRRLIISSKWGWFTRGVSKEWVFGVVTRVLSKNIWACLQVCSLTADPWGWQKHMNHAGIGMGRDGCKDPNSYNRQLYKYCVNVKHKNLTVAPGNGSNSLIHDSSGRQKPLKHEYCKPKSKKKQRLGGHSKSCNIL